ncbi:MAG: 2-isopropylmalate synthase [Candidatus Aminicenantes bacterium]|nr:2-isopropylmalate synthase [Candidatus Aminicenantes bacterium]
MGNKIKIFDTTLRDGEQSPGASMSVDQKVEMAAAFENLGVDRIEAGFPVSSPIQFDGVKRIGEVVKNSTVVALARCVKGDIDAAAKALKNSKNRMIHVFLATSHLHREYKLKMNKQEILDRIAKNVAYAKRFADKIEFSPEDASRTEPEFLVEVCKTAIRNGATCINIPDTVGYAIPEEFGRLIAFLRDQVPEFTKEDLDLSVHCHNDLGLAVANSITAVQQGATQVEATLNGIGERAGNCSLEELVMALIVRKDLLDFQTRIKTELLYPTSKLLQHITGLMIARNKPIFGDNAFAHESGIHQDGVLKYRETYEIMNPKKIGRSPETLVMGRHSGKHSLQEKLQEYGICLNDQQFNKVFAKFTQIADFKKEVYDEDIFNIVASELGRVSEGYKLKYFHVYTGNTLYPSATVKIKKEDREYVAAETGDGPVDALFRAIETALNLELRLKDFMINAIGWGKDAQGQVNIMVEIDGKNYVGKGTSTDILEASAYAYLNAINRHCFRTNRKKIQPEAYKKTKEVQHGQ